jgi:hypothetical protein
VVPMVDASVGSMMMVVVHVFYRHVGFPTYPVIALLMYC